MGVQSKPKRVSSRDRNLHSTFKTVHIGSYYSQIVIKNNYFNKIKRKYFSNSNLVILNELNCRYIKYKTNNKKQSNYECDFRLTNLSKNKKYYFAEYPYKKNEKPKFFKLVLPKKYKKTNIEKLFTIKFNKILFKDYLNSLKNENKKQIQIKLIRSIINPYCYIGVKSTMCKFLVLLNLGSSYVVRIKNENNNMNKKNKQRKQNFSILTIPRKYVLGTRLNVNF